METLAMTDFHMISCLIQFLNRQQTWEGCCVETEGGLRPGSKEFTRWELRSRGVPILGFYYILDHHPKPGRQKAPAPWAVRDIFDLALIYRFRRSDPTRSLFSQEEKRKKLVVLSPKKGRGESGQRKGGDATNKGEGVCAGAGRLTRWQCGGNDCSMVSDEPRRGEGREGDRERERELLDEIVISGVCQRPSPAAACPSFGEDTPHTPQFTWPRIPS